MRKKKVTLTPNQEAFCQNVAKGVTHIDAMLDAYPVRKTWERQVVSQKASEALNNVNIKERIAELRRPADDAVKNFIKERELKILEIAYDKLTGDREKGDTSVLNKMLDKILASKTETKSEVSHTFNISFNQIKNE